MVKNVMRKLRQPRKRVFQPARPTRPKQRVIIHITGCSGAGKTTVGKRISKRFGNKVVVKDLDDLRAEYIAKRYASQRWTWNDFDSKGYQAFLDQYIAKIIKPKPLVLTGLNQIYLHDKKLYYNIHATHRFYLDVPDTQVVKQKCLRFIKELQNIVKMEHVVDDITNNNKRFVKLTNQGLVSQCGVKHITKLNTMWKKDYTKQKYTFLPPDDIYQAVSSVLART